MKSSSVCVCALVLLFGCGEAPVAKQDPVAETVSEALSYGNHGFAWVALDTVAGTWKVQNNFSWSSGSVPFPTVTRDGTGLFTVTFAGLNAAYSGPGNRGNVQIVATNQGGTGSIFNNTRCKVAGWGTPPTQQVSVACYGTSGALADSPFIVHYVQADGAILGSSGYVRTTGDPSSDAPYNPTATWSGNTSGGLNTIDRTGVGLYTVTLGGLAAPLCGVYPPCYGGNAQVTAHGAGASYCKISSFAPAGAEETVNVRCYDAAGALADSHFSLNFDHRPSSQYGIGAHAWANDMTLASYAPDPAHSYNSDRGGFGSGTNLALRQQRGVFQMRHFGLENNKAAPFVTAYGADNFHCKIEKWGTVPGTGRDVQVETRCWHPIGGAPQDSRYLETFVSRRKPDFSDGDLDGYTPEAGDCNDANPNVYPGAIEACNGVDDDCDTQTDEGVCVSVTALALGSVHTCALLSDGRVKCWGDNQIGELGLGDTSHRGDNPGEMGGTLPAVNLGTGRTATAITAGAVHTCALLDNGQAKCWGYNAMGQLGLGDTADRGDNPGEMGDALPAIDLGTGRSAVALDAGDFHTCALLDNAQLKCWGNGLDGRLGLGDTAHRGDNPGEMGDALPAVSLGNGRTATLVQAGELHTCALLDNAQVKCWGRGILLGLGDALNRGDAPGTMGDNLPAVNLGTGRTGVTLSLGLTFACALLDNTDLKCWGANGYGNLGQGDTLLRGDQPGEMGDSLLAVNLGTGRSATAISTGFTHACALLDNAQLKCWGGGGSLGLGDTANRGDNPGEMGDSLPAVDLGTGLTATVLTPHAGSGYTCVGLSSLELKCWGSNGPGQLGLGDTVPRGDGPGEMGDNLLVVDL